MAPLLLMPALPHFAHAQGLTPPVPADRLVRSDPALFAALVAAATAALPASETEPAIKGVASALAIALTTYEAGESPLDIALRLPQGSGALAGTFHVPGAWSRGRVVYPQLGGLLPQAASVMVVVEQTLGTADGAVTTITRTLDIRVRRAGQGWAIEALASIGGTPPEQPVALAPEAVAVLEDGRIELPDSARWDIMAGLVSPRLLSVMARLADQTPYGVITIVTGHPWEIFGTDRQSDHSRGLAFDVYRIGDGLVIDQRTAGSPTHGVVNWLFSQPDIARIGSPWALDGFGGRSFTDALHQDHLHIAVPRE